MAMAMAVGLKTMAFSTVGALDNRRLPRHRAMKSNSFFASEAGFKIYNKFGTSNFDLPASTSRASCLSSCVSFLMTCALVG
jgi:hypothetical protein